MNKIVIAIPVYNEEQHIKECLKSVLAFEIPKNVEHEIWVIDGGSKDQTLSITKTLQKKNKIIKILKNHGQTQSHAMNLSIKESKHVSKLKNKFLSFCLGPNLVFYWS